MEYQEYCFVDVARGGVCKRNNVLHVMKAQFPGETDCYRTYFRYSSDFKKHVDQTGSVKGFTGMAYADYFPIDIDATDPGEALLVLRALLDNLTNAFELDPQQIPLFFSGAKGFHLYLPAPMIEIVPCRDIAQVFKKFAELLLSPWGIKYDAGIYDPTRLLRCVNKKKKKSGLFKIPITSQEAMSLDMPAIQEMAKQQRAAIRYAPSVRNTGLVAIYRTAGEEVRKHPKLNGEVMESQFIPKDAKLCIISILKGVGSGQRDESAYRLACHYRKQGLPEDMVEGILQAWNQRNNPPLPDRDLTSRIKSAFSSGAKNDHGCNDHILKAHCDPSCYLLKKASRLDDDSIIKTIDEAGRDYEDYVQHLKEKGVVIDIPVIGPAIRKIAPGEVMVIIARSGVGKTAFIINLMPRIFAKNDFPILFFTLEQPTPQVYERAAQMAMGLKGRDIEEIFAGIDQQARGEVKDRARKLFSNALFVDKDFLTVDEMISIVRLAEQKINRKIGAVAIDYLGRMKNSGKNSYEFLSETALAIKHMAKELDVAVICAAQTSRTGGDGSQEVDFDSARGSGQIEEAADFLIGMWKPDTAPDSIRLRLLKNRKGPKLMDYDMQFSGNTMRIDSEREPFWPAIDADNREYEEGEIL